MGENIFSKSITVLFILSTLYTQQALGQFSDDFEDGHFTSNPEWSSNIAGDWAIVANQLRSNTGQLGVAKSYYITTPSQMAVSGQWEFFVNLKFSTSGTNYADVYLLADNPDLLAVANGYFVRIGNADDEVSLYQLVGGVPSKIIDGANGTVNSSSNNPFRIKVIRTTGNAWTLFIDDGDTGVYTEHGTVVNDAVNLSSHAGIRIVQSTAATPANNHFFDDFVVGEIPAPSIADVSQVSAVQLDVDFSEDVDEATAETFSNFIIGVTQATASVRDPLLTSDLKKVRVTFPPATFQPGLNMLTVINVEGLFGNTIPIDPGATGEFTADVSAPTVSSITQMSNTVLDVIFSEPVDEVLAETALNYEVNGNLPLSAERDPLNVSNFSKVRLTFTPGDILASNQITIINIADVVGNAISPIVIPNFQADVIAPTLDAVTVVSPTELNVIFSEVVAEASAENVLNYTVSNGIGTPSSATLQQDNRTVRVSFIASFPDSEQRTLAVTGVEDVFDNAIAANPPTTLEFVYVSVNGFADDFADGEIATNPNWQGNSDEWAVEDGRLRINDMDDGNTTLYLSTPNNRLVDTEWRIMVDPGVALSTTNQIRIYLAADQPTLTGDVNGYVLEIGQSGDDQILFRKQAGQALTTLIMGTTLWNGNFKANIKVTRSALGEWKVFADREGGEDFELEGSASDNEFGTTQHFGIVTKYSAGNSEKYYYDNIYIGDYIIDTTAPFVSAIKVVDASQIEMVFNERVEHASAEALQNYSALQGVGHATAAQLQPDQKTVRVTFENNFPNATPFTATVKNITDKNGNISGATNHELMFVGTFSDAFNQLQLTDSWTVSGGGSDFIVEDVDGNFQVRSNNHTEQATFYFTHASNMAYGQWEFSLNLKLNTSGVNYADVFVISNFSDLVAEGINGYFVRIGGTPDEISLYKREAGVNTLIIDGNDGVTNTTNNELKIRVIRNELNEWTLEYDTTGSGEEYTSAGSANEGTFSNSSFFGFLIKQSTESNFGKHFFDNVYVGPIVPDVIPPRVISVSPLSQRELVITFSERLEESTAETAANYSVNNQIGIASTAVLQPNGKSVRVTFSNDFINDSASLAAVQGVADRYANVITSTETLFSYVNHIETAFDDVTLENSWVLDEGDFVVEEIDGRKLLRSNKLVEDASFAISRPCNRVSGQWEFYANLKFPTSGTNYADIFLISDRQDLTSADVNGYFVRIGGSEDEISLYKRTNGINEAIIDPDTDKGLTNKSDNVVRIKVIRTQQNDWSLYYDPSGTGENYLSHGSVNDTTHSISSYFGFFIRQSSEDYFNKHYFDNLYIGPEIPDLIGPTVKSVAIVSAAGIQLKFSEPVVPAHAASNANYFVEGVGNPVEVSAATDDEIKVVSLKFETPFIKGREYSLILHDITDLSGNVADPTPFGFIFELPEQALSKDIIITEVMADVAPPPAGLPDKSYVEIYNRSDKYINLARWKLADRNSEATLPEYLLRPGEYAIMVRATDAPDFGHAIRTLPMTNFIDLNISGDDLILKDSTGVKIDSISYAQAWYHDSEKSGGGWSLERIDPNNLCAENENWTACENESGGTPAAINSVFAEKPDLIPPDVVSVFAVTPDTIVVAFNEKLNVKIPSASSFMFSPDIAIEAISFVDQTLRGLVIKPVTPLQPRTQYSISLKDVSDCAGNAVAETEPLQFVLPEEPEGNDIVINEVLFNPHPMGVDFVEVFNRSEKHLNLKGWSLANLADSAIENRKTIAESNLISAPGDFLVFTSDPNILKGEYLQSNENKLHACNLPSLPDDEGSVALLDERGRIIDTLKYSDDQHSPFLKNPEGVSLERVDINSPSSNKSNWQSASVSTGYATPGFQNGSAMQHIFEDAISIEPEIFAPKSGQEFTMIAYHLERAGYVANVKIVSPQGQVIKKVAENELLGVEGFFTWHGDTSAGSKATIGAYMVWFEAFDESGNVITIKKRVVVADRF